MAQTLLPARQARAYLRAAHRQLAMAEEMPRQHRAKFNRFLKLHPGLPFAQEFAALLAELYPKRERSLYADIELGEVTDPTLAYSRADAQNMLARTRGMVAEIEALLT